MLHLGEQGQGVVQAVHTGGQVVAGEFLQDQGFHLAARKPGGKHAAGCRVEQAEAGAGDHVDGDRPARPLPAHHHRAAVTPHRQRGGFVDLVAQLGNGGHAHPHPIQAVDGHQPDVEREGAQVVAGGEGVLLHEAGADQADQIAVCLGRRHLGGGGDVLEHHRALATDHRLENAHAHFQGLDSVFAFQLFAHDGDSRVRLRLLRIAQ